MGREQPRDGGGVGAVSIRRWGRHGLGIQAKRKRRGNGDGPGAS